MTPANSADFLSLSQDRRYEAAIRSYGRDIARFVAGYEKLPAKREELLQEVHLAVWQSMRRFQGNCSLRTWTYRVAHNVCASHVRFNVRGPDRDSICLDEISENPASSAMDEADRRIDLQKIRDLIHMLRLVDRQVMLCYLEGLEAAEIAELTGLSASSVATKVHRLKALIARQLAQGSTT